MQPARNCSLISLKSGNANLKKYKELPNYYKNETVTIRIYLMKDKLDCDTCGLTATSETGVTAAEAVVAALPTSSPQQILDENKNNRTKIFLLIRLRNVRHHNLNFILFLLS